MIKKTMMAACALLACGAVWANQAGEHLITKISKGKLAVDSTFKTPFGMTGYVVTPKGKSQRMIMFTDASGKYLFVGNVISAKGENLTQMYNQKYVMGPMAQKAYKDLVHTHYFADGKGSAPHKAYVVMDPNCIYCHLLFKELRPMIDAGKVQIRWIPVGFLKQDSMGKAAALLHAKTDAERVKLLNEDEDTFDMHAEEGGLHPLAHSKSNMSVASAYSKAAQNNAFFKKYLQGTPAIFFKDQSGKVQLIPSYIEKAQLKKAVSQMSSQW